MTMDSTDSLQARENSQTSPGDDLAADLAAMPIEVRDIAVAAIICTAAIEFPELTDSWFDELRVQLLAEAADIDKLAATWLETHPFKIDPE